MGDNSRYPTFTNLILKGLVWWDAAAHQWVTKGPDGKLLPVGQDAKSARERMRRR